MIFPTNLAIDILKVFRDTLHGMYEKREIDNFYFLSMERYAGKSRTQLLSDKNIKISESVINNLVYVIEKLRDYTPIQYILGEVFFCELKLNIDHRALIPRPETEQLVSLLLNDYRNKHHSLTILDAGTGSGCIAIALKKYLPDADIIAIDNSHEALMLAKENALINTFDIAFEKIDILDSLQMDTLPFVDVIISNPPYVKESEKKQMQSNVLNFEPHAALFVHDSDPLIYYRTILQFAERKLKNGGRIYFEINETLGAELLIQIKNYGFTASVENDIHSRPRFCLIKKPG